MGKNRNKNRGGASYPTMGEDTVGTIFDAERTSNSGAKLEETQKIIEGGFNAGVTAVDTWYDDGSNSVYMVEYNEENPNGQLYEFDPNTEHSIPIDSDVNYLNRLGDGFITVNGRQYKFLGTDILANGQSNPL